MKFNVGDIVIYNGLCGFYKGVVLFAFEDMVEVGLYGADFGHSGINRDDYKFFSKNELCWITEPSRLSHDNSNILWEVCI